MEEAEGPRAKESETRGPREERQALPRPSVAVRAAEWRPLTLSATAAAVRRLSVRARA